MGERTAVRTGSAFRLPKKRKYIRKKQRQYLPLHAVKRTIACTRSRGGVMPTFQNDPNPVFRNTRNPSPALKNQHG